MSLKFGAGSEYLSHCVFLMLVTALPCCHLQYGSGRKSREVRGAGLGGRRLERIAGNFRNSRSRLALSQDKASGEDREGRVTPVTCLPAPTLLISLLIFFLISHYY